MDVFTLHGEVCNINLEYFNKLGLLPGIELTLVKMNSELLAFGSLPVC